MSYEEFIETRGSGPVIKGTRITVFTVLEYLIGAFSREEIADLLGLTAVFCLSRIWKNASLGLA